MENISIATAKIQILYLVSKVPNVGYHQLTDECLSMLTMDFFTFSQAYNELISGNLMDKNIEDQEESVSITPGGEAILNDVVNTINNTILLRLNKSADKVKKDLENKKQSLVKISMLANGKYMVNLTKQIDGNVIFDCSIEVNSKERTESIRRMWKQDSERLYKQFINSLSNEGAD